MNSATAAMLDGIKESCECWGRAMRWVLTSNGEGYPNLATFERARNGDLDANSVKVLRQRYGEVLLGDALAISLAIRRPPMMPEEAHRVLFMHFVVPRWLPGHQKLSVRQKARELGYESARPYYVMLDHAYHFLLARVEVECFTKTFCADSVRTDEKCAHT